MPPRCGDGFVWRWGAWGCGGRFRVVFSAIGARVGCGASATLITRGVSAIFLGEVDQGVEEPSAVSRQPSAVSHQRLRTGHGESSGPTTAMYTLARRPRARPGGFGAVGSTLPLAAHREGRRVRGTNRCPLGTETLSVIIDHISVLQCEVRSGVAWSGLLKHFWES